MYKDLPVPDFLFLFSSLSTEEAKSEQMSHGMNDPFSEPHDVRYSFPLSGLESQEIDYR